MEQSRDIWIYGIAAMHIAAIQYHQNQQHYLCRNAYIMAEENVHGRGRGKQWTFLRSSVSGELRKKLIHKFLISLTFCLIFRSSFIDTDEEMKDFCIHDHLKKGRTTVTRTCKTNHLSCKVQGCKKSVEFLLPLSTTMSRKTSSIEVLFPHSFN